MPETLKERGITLRYFQIQGAGIGLEAKFLAALSTDPFQLRKRCRLADAAYNPSGNDSIPGHDQSASKEDRGGQRRSICLIPETISAF
jgi:hypothetical protein